LDEELSGVEVLDDLAADHRGEHEYTNRRVCSVDELMRTVLAPREAGDVPLLQHLFALRRAQRRLAPEHEHPFLVQVVRVVGPEPVARLDFGHGRADQLTADALAHERALDAPALAIPRPVPVVAVEVESLHWIPRIRPAPEKSKSGLARTARGSTPAWKAAQRPA